MPVAILLMIVGYCLFHCAWAAHLLDEPETTVIRSQRENDLEATPMHQEGPAPQQGAAPGDNVFESIYGNEDQLKDVPTGFWQFSERPAWQAVNSRDRLN